MPEPRPTVRTTGVPPPLWPDTLPDPQAPSMQVTGPLRTEFSRVLTGPTRGRVVARTAPMSFVFECWLTPAQMEIFEDWYRLVVLEADGEFYARWIGGSRVVAFAEPYAYSRLGINYVLRGRLITTRIDHSACDAYIDAVYGGILRDDGIAADIVRDDGIAADIVRDDFDLAFMADHEC